MESSETVPAVTSCSTIIMQRFVIMVTETPRLRAASKADKRGGEVRLGVRKVSEIVAVEMRWSSMVLRGVGGGVGGERKGLNEGNRWWGEGRRVIRKDHVEGG